MSIFTKAVISLVLPAVCIGVADSAAGNIPTNFDLSRYAYKAKGASSVFESDRMKMINKANDILDGKKGTKRNKASQPIHAQLGPAEAIKDIDTPWGEVWFYTSAFKYSYIKVSEDYNRPILEEYEFKIYDSQMNLKGTIRDRMSYKTYTDAPRDPATATEVEKKQIELYGPYHREVAVANCELTPIVTRNFFNTDDKFEIMVGMSVQTTYYVNNNYNRVYQLNGETYQGTDKDGNAQTYNKMITDIPSQLGDVYTKVDGNGKEITYMTFMDDFEPEEIEMPDIDVPAQATRAEEGDGEGDGDGEGSDLFIPGFWEQYCAYATDIAMFRGVKEGEKEIQRIWTKHLPLSQLPGNMDTSPFIMTFEKDGKMHLMTQYYKDTFYNRYDSPVADMTMRENNSLVIEIYEINADENGFTLIQSTEIPTYLTASTESTKILFSYFSTGDFRYRDDINFKDFTTNGKAAFFITKRDYIAGNDDQYLTSYYLYDDNGKLLNTIYVNAESHLSMSDLPGFEPQELFISRDNMGDFIFHFIDLRSLKEVTNFSWKFQSDPYSDPERITSNLDRIKIGDTYKYAVESRYPIQEGDYDIGRILWLNRDGSFDHVDEVNLGTGVYYAQTYISSTTLDPNFYYKDDKHEYMALVKRGMIGESTVEELLIAQARDAEHPEGVEFLTASPDERGSLTRIMPYKYNDQNMLILVRNSLNGPFYWDVYSLPFTSNGSNSGVEDIPAVAGDDQIAFNGASVVAEGYAIEIFDIKGLLVAKGESNVDVTSLDAGIYLARANGKTLKFHVR